MRVVAYVPDLMDRSRLTAAAGSTSVRFVDRPADLAAAQADLVLVDLARPGVLDALAAAGGGTGAGGRVVGFGPHVEGDLLRAARAAGCHEVLPRSAFFRRVPELLTAPT